MCYCAATRSHILEVYVILLASFRQARESQGVFGNFLNRWTLCGHDFICRSASWLPSLPLPLSYSKYPLISKMRRWWHYFPWLTVSLKWCKGAAKVKMRCTGKKCPDEDISSTAKRMQQCTNLTNNSRLQKKNLNARQFTIACGQVMLSPLSPRRHCQVFAIVPGLYRVFRGKFRSPASPSKHEDRVLLCCPTDSIATFHIKRQPRDSNTAAGTGSIVGGHLRSP